MKSGFTNVNSEGMSAYISWCFCNVGYILIFSSQNHFKSSDQSSLRSSECCLSRVQAWGKLVWHHFKRLQKEKKFTILLLWGATPTTLYPEKPRTSRTSTGERLVSTILSPVLDGLGMPSNTLPEILKRKLSVFSFSCGTLKETNRRTDHTSIALKLVPAKKARTPIVSLLQDQIGMMRSSSWLVSLNI